MSETVKISDIKIMDQPRKDFSRVDELAESIKASGLIQPVAVIKDEEGDVILVDGEQRIRALKKLGKTEVPIHFIDSKTVTEMREAQLTANLMRSDLALIERMRGFQMLLQSAPAKYNELVIANRFGLKEKEVKKMVALAKALEPTVDASLASGQYDQEEIDELARVPKQFQDAVVKSADKSGCSIDRGIQANSDELHFDDVFTLEQARSAGKLHMQDAWDKTSWRTFDRAYATKVKKEFEYRTKKKHDDELAKEKTKTVQQKELSAEQKKKRTDKERAERQAALQGLSSAVKKATTTMPQPKEVRRILEDQLRKIQSEHLRTILRAHSVEFKATNCSTDDMRKLALKHVFQDISTAAQLVGVITVIDAASYGIDAKGWAKNVLKSL